MKNSSPRHLQPHKESIRIMTCREKTLRILRSLRSRCLAHQKDYQQIVQQADRLLLKSFFLKLSDHKKEFATKLQEEIEKLEKELAPNSQVFSKISIEKRCTPLFKTSMHERHGLIKECYRREKRNIHLYDQALSHINEGNVRELLLSQKAKTKSWLREIKCMGIRIYEDVEVEQYPSPFEFDLN